MRRVTTIASVVLLSAVCALSAHAQTPSASPQKIDLAEQLTAGKLKAFNRDVTAGDASRRAVRVNEKEGNGIVWIDGTDFALGTIEIDIKGRDVMQRSFVGVAFHGKDDKTYEAVYLRPFNFRSTDQVRRDHAVQYISLPDYDWPRLRKEFPEEFENPVDQSIVPTDFVPVKIVVTAKNVQIFVGNVKTPTLEVRRLGTLERGMIGVWAGNGSDGEYANLRITPAK